jgi:hypothetical protein
MLPLMLMGFLPMTHFIHYFIHVFAMLYPLYQMTTERVAYEGKFVQSSDTKSIFM